MNIAIALGAFHASADSAFISVVNGAPYGVFEVDTAGNVTRGKIEFEDEPEPGELPLTFDPLGAAIGVERRGDRYFERVFPTIP